jgi:hypothetical protein
MLCYYQHLFRIHSSLRHEHFKSSTGQTLRSSAASCSSCSCKLGTIQGSVWSLTGNQSTRGEVGSWCG